ncbi:MAG: hypothetical protein ABGZ35_11860 [Planctomycetaceae bacterium]|jgi:hypothetical protein
MPEQSDKRPAEPTLSTIEGNLFGELFGFHKKVMELLRNAKLSDDKLELVSERIEQLLGDVTAEINRSKTLDLAGQLESAYEEGKSMVDELSVFHDGRS